MDPGGHQEEFDVRIHGGIRVVEKKDTQRYRDKQKELGLTFTYCTIPLLSVCLHTPWRNLPK